MPHRFIRLSSLALALGCFSIFSAALTSKSGNTSIQSPDTLRDGQHDFDFDLGAWKTHSSRLLHPLTGSTTWADMDGITIVNKVWDGRANLAEYKADGPGGHIELLSLRWYNAAAHQWNLDFATPNGGSLGIPGAGEFKNGRGDFYDQEDFNDKMILVRFSIWRISDTTAQSEQAFSADGGKTWEVNWINKYTRINGPAEIDWNPQAAGPEQAAQHDFDFNIGTWHTHINRIPDPFTDPSNSVEVNGTVTVRKVWGGLAELEEIEADGPKGHWEGMTLFLYNPKSHQWSQNFIDAEVATLSTPTVGEFKNGRGDLFCGDTFKGRSILVRGTWSDITPNSHRYEEFYSNDGGQTWKAAFRASLTREKN